MQKCSTFLKMIENSNRSKSKLSTLVLTCAVNLLLVVFFQVPIEGITQIHMNVKFGVLEQDGFRTEGKFHIQATQRYCKVEIYDKNKSTPTTLSSNLTGVKSVEINQDSSIVTYLSNLRFVFSLDSANNYNLHIFDNYGKLKKKYSNVIEFEEKEQSLQPKLDSKCLYLNNASNGFLRVGKNNIRYEVNGIGNENLILKSSTGHVTNLLGSASVTIQDTGSVVLSIQLEKSGHIIYEKRYSVLSQKSVYVEPKVSSAQDLCAFIIVNRGMHLLKGQVNFIEVENADYFKKTCNVKVEGAELLGFENGFLKIKVGYLSEAKIYFTEKESGHNIYSSTWQID